ncbi:unnamed protein product [Discula destructiva]
MFAQSLLLDLLLAATAVLAAPVATNIEARGVIGHDEVVGFPETVPNDVTGSLMLTYKPFLKIFNGCVPYPAVDAEGNTSGGLDTSGSSSGGCSSSTGQVYARAAQYNEYFAIMYAWFMAKDSPSPGMGHRFDWEQSIVWLSDSNTTEPTLVGFSVSAHGGSDTSRTPGLSGTHPLAGYKSNWPTNHQLVQTTEVGGSQPLIAWESLPAAAQTALQDTDFGSAIVPFKDSTFTANLEKGYAAF